MLKISKEKLEDVIKKRYSDISESYVSSCAENFVKNLDERLWPNLLQWINDETITDIWIGKYCVNAIMSIRGDSDFLDALDTMNLYLTDEDAGVKRIWRMRR